MAREILIQEEYLTDPWKMLVCCILLNQTNNKQVRPILLDLFRYIPNPESASIANPLEISSIIKKTGFQNVKADRIIKLSNKWVSGFKEVSELPGIGQYGKDSWEIFINKNLSIIPTDKKLSAYLRNIND
jgi:methyl-CpG-binding domain protein 4